MGTARSCSAAGADGLAAKPCPCRLQARSSTDGGAAEAQQAARQPERCQQLVTGQCTSTYCMGMASSYERERGEGVSAQSCARKDKHE